MNSELVRHVKNNYTIQWNFKTLSLNQNVTLSVLKHFENENWDWSILTNHKNWNWEWVRCFPCAKWNWYILSTSIYFSWNWVREFPNAPWNWTALSSRIEGIDIIKEFPCAPWDWYILTIHEKTSLKDMMECSYFPWKINSLLFRFLEDEEIEFIRFFKSHYDKDAWEDHTQHTLWSNIKKNLDLPWVPKYIIVDVFENEDLYLIKGWNMNHLSAVVSLDIIMKNPEFEWNMNIVSQRSGVNYIHYPNLNWNMHSINLDFERNRWLAAWTIQRYWKRCVSDPSYIVCKKRLIRECNMLKEQK